MTSTWSNGWMSTAPVSAANARAAPSASSTVAPAKRTCAPYAWVAATFGSGAASGMKTVEVHPSSDAASATPCAWLPALAATTPCARSCSDSRAMRTYAPRILNEPARWRFSHLIETGPPTSFDRARIPSSGSRAGHPEEQRRAPLAPAPTRPRAPWEPSPAR
jgi:hypothetical protein